MSLQSFSDWLSNFSNGVIASIVSSALFVFFCLYFFNRERLKTNINTMKSWLRPAIGWNVLEPLNSKKQIGIIYKLLFLDVESIGSGELLLMSNSGGVPEFNPYSKILNLARTSRNGNIYVAVTKASFKEWSRRNGNVLVELIDQQNIQIYLFDNLTPSNYRLAVNTHIGRGFIAYNFGNEGDKNIVEGFSTENDIAIESIRRLFFALVEGEEGFRGVMRPTLIPESQPALLDDSTQPQREPATLWQTVGRRVALMSTFLSRRKET